MKYKRRALRVSLAVAGMGAKWLWVSAASMEVVMRTIGLPELTSDGSVMPERLTELVVA